MPNGQVPSQHSVSANQQPEGVLATPVPHIKEWQQSVTSDLRVHLIKKVLQVLTVLYPNDMQDKLKKDYMVAYARKVEEDTYKTANSRSEYYHRLAEKIYTIQREHSVAPNVDNNAPVAVVLNSDYNDQSLKNILSGLETLNISNSPANNLGMEGSQLASSQLSGGGLPDSGQVSATPVTHIKEWQRSVTSDLRDHLINKVLQAFPSAMCPNDMQDKLKKDYLVAYARKVEEDIYNTANSRQEYYHTLAAKIFTIQEEFKGK